jgi:hypothetical protein
VVAQDHARGVVAGGAGDAAAGMRAATAMIQTFQRPTIIGMAEHRPGREELVEGKGALNNFATEQGVLALKVERRQHPLPDHACRDTRRLSVHGRDHEIGDLRAMIEPRAAVGQ